MKAKRDPLILSCVELGGMKEALIILDRLSDLPEFGMQEDVRRVKELAQEVEMAEKALSDAKDAFRRKAVSTVEKVIETWTPEEILEATGY